MACGNRLPISGECMIGCGGFGGCRHGFEAPIPERHWPAYRGAFTDRTDTAQEQPNAADLNVNETATDGA